MMLGSGSSSNTDQFWGGATDMGIGNGAFFYAVGTTDGTVGGQASAGGWDIVLVKYGSDGSKIWTRQVGTANSDQGRAVATDGTHGGAVYVAGYVNNAFGGNTHLGSTDAILIKYDSDGTLLWSRQFGSSDVDQARAVAVDTSGNVLVTGYTEGSFDGMHHYGEKDAFLIKFDSSGAKLFSRQIGTGAVGGNPTNELGTAVTSDSSDSMIVAMDWGANVYYIKYTATGSVVWHGSQGTHTVRAVVTDSDDNVYFGGQVSGNYEGFVGAGGSDMYVQKLDAGTGAIEWTQVYGTSGSDSVWALGMDKWDNLLATG